MTGKRFTVVPPEGCCAGWLMHNRQDCDCYADERALAELVEAWMRGKRWILRGLAIVTIASVAWAIGMALR
ncbi:hypothetical protein BH09PSE4_BH09PSE4_22890 [soil metagenome]